MTFKTHLYTNPHFPIASPGSVAILFRGIPFEYSNDVVIAHFAFVFFCWFSMNVMPPTFMPNTEKDGSCCRSSEPRVLFMSNFSNAGRYMKIPSHTHTMFSPAEMELWRNARFMVSQAKWYICEMVSN